MPRSLALLREDIITCERGPRLRSYCQRIARERRAAYRTETYWGKPVPGFGDPSARVLVLGLAPAAHGANRTGRVFTGDGMGGSGDFLMRAMHAAGFASIPTSRHPDDDLRLTDAYITAAVRCAPPDNKPSTAERAACLPYLEDEFAALRGMRVIVTLGKIADDTVHRIVKASGTYRSPRAPFKHGAETLVSLPGSPAAVVLASYHPSRQNTNTGVLTEPMLDAIFVRARALITSPS